MIEPIRRTKSERITSRISIDFGDELSTMINEEADKEYLTPTAYIKNTMGKYIRQTREKRLIDASELQNKVNRG